MDFWLRTLRFALRLARLAAKAPIAPMVPMPLTVVKLEDAVEAEDIGVPTLEVLEVRNCRAAPVACKTLKHILKADICRSLSKSSCRIIVGDDSEFQFARFCLWGLSAKKLDGDSKLTPFSHPSSSAWCDKSTHHSSCSSSYRQGHHSTRPTGRRHLAENCHDFEVAEETHRSDVFFELRV